MNRTAIAAVVVGALAAAGCGLRPPDIRLESCSRWSPCPGDMYCGDGGYCRFVHGCTSDGQCRAGDFCMEDGGCYAGVADTTGLDIFLGLVEAAGTAASIAGSGDGYDDGSYDDGSYDGGSYDDGYDDSYDDGYSSDDDED